MQSSFSLPSSRGLALSAVAGLCLLFAPVALWAQQSISVRQLALTHSGAYDFFMANGQPAGDSLYPYVARMAEAGGHEYLLDGAFGPNFDPSNPADAFVAEVEAVTQDGFISQWRRDSDTLLEIDNVPGTTFADKAYTSLMVSPRNYVGYWFDETTGELLRTDEGIPEGLNPQNDPVGFQTLVDEYVAAINVFARRAPGATVHLYEFLPPAFAFPYANDPSQDNTIAVSHIDAYVNYSLGLYQDWLDALATGIRNHPQLEDGVHLVPVPINRVIGRLLLDHPELLTGRDWFDFARDDAPHFGDVDGSSDFFEAFLAPVLYGVLFDQAVPSGFTLEPGNIFEDDFALITDYVATALDTDASNGGSDDDSGGGGSGGDPTVTRVEDTDSAWTLTTGTRFDPAADGLPAAENDSVISLSTASSQAQLTFTGTGIRLYGVVFPGGNTGRIALDGGAPTTVDWQADPAQPGQLLWESGTLADDTHTVTIASEGDWIAIDYVEILDGDADDGGGGGGGETGPALSGVDLGFIGTFSHSAWGDRVPNTLGDAVTAANPAAGNVGFQVQWGSGYDAHVALLPDGDPTANGGAGSNVVVAAQQADTGGSDATLFGIGYLADYIPDEENPPDSGPRSAYAEHQFVDLPDGFTGTLSLEALAGTTQVNVPYNLARMAVASQADVLWNTPAYPALNELGEPFTRLDPATYVAEVRERTALGAVGTANAFSLIEASSADYSGELRLFSAPNDLLIAWIEQAPAWLSGDANRISEVRDLVDPAVEPSSLAAAYTESDFLAYPQDSLFVDGGGHFTQLPHLLFAHAMLLTRLAEIDPAFLEEDLSYLVRGGVSSELATFLHTLVVEAVRNQLDDYRGHNPPAPPAPPVVTRPDVAGTYEFIVAADGSGLTDSIQAAVNAALPGDTIRIRPGTYPESVSVATRELTLIADGEVIVTGHVGGTHGFRIDANDIELRGFTVRGISGQACPGDHAATGFVLNAARTRLIDCVSHSNGNNGFLVLPDARNVRIQGGSAFDNTVSGIGLAGGTDITIRDMTFYSTGGDGGPDGSFQASAILTENWGDSAASPRLPIEGIQPIDGLTIDNVTVYDHPDYGIRISAYNETLSRFPSGRIATTNLQLTNSHIYNNGSRLSDFTGGLYHLGGILLQHIDGGLVAGNVIEDNYFWGIDAYRCNDFVYRDNWFLNNNRGMDTPGITFEPVNVEINGGLRNEFSNNLVYGSFAGLFLSWIPDSNDGALFGPDSITVEGNIMAGHTEGGFSMVVNGSGLSSRTVRNNFIERVDPAHLLYLREDLGIDLEAPELGNRIGSAPGFADAPNDDFSLLPTSPLRQNSWGPANLRPATAPDFDEWILEALGAGAPTADLDATADPDRDNRPNLIEYATGGRPGLPDSDALMTLDRTSDTIASLDVVLRGNDPSLACQIRYSDNLQDWTTATLTYDGMVWASDTGTVQVESAQALGNGLWRLTLSLTVPGDSIFARLSVERVPDQP